ncbi:MAG: hypothetical protein Q8P13_00665 [bacterium]|nr:hypothetical protein [bacterium]
MRLKILLVILGSLLLASGTYLGINKLKPQQKEQSSVAVVVENKVATKSADLAQEMKKEDPKQPGKVKGSSTKTNPPAPYQPSQELVGYLQPLTQGLEVEAQTSTENPNSNETKDCTPITQPGTWQDGVGVTVTIDPCTNIKQDQPLINP